jgi:hypothetical protein
LDNFDLGRDYTTEREMQISAFRTLKADNSAPYQYNGCHGMVAWMKNKACFLSASLGGAFFVCAALGCEGPLRAWRQKREPKAKMSAL